MVDIWLIYGWYKDFQQKWRGSQREKWRIRTLNGILQIGFDWDRKNDGDWMGFGRESRRKMEDLRGIWRISEGFLNRISYLMISSDMFMGSIKNIWISPTNIGIEWCFTSEKEDSMGFNQEKWRIEWDLWGLTDTNWWFDDIYPSGILM